MKRQKSLRVLIGVLIGCLTLAAVGYARMGGGHHGSGDRLDSGHGYHHNNSSHHDSNYNDHHGEYHDRYQGYENSHRYNRSNGQRSRFPDENHSGNEMERDMIHDDYIERRPGGSLQHGSQSVPER